jgi:hypothetical protein
MVNNIGHAVAILCAALLCGSIVYWGSKRAGEGRAEYKAACEARGGTVLELARQPDICVAKGALIR